ncbi:hypothetical protein ACSBR2_024113 [Camellia fascicularis]
MCPTTLCFMAFRLEEFFHELYILSDLVVRLHYGFLSTFFVEQSLLVTGFGYEHDNAWCTNIELFKEFIDVNRGVRRLGDAAVDMCHVALGIVEAYWEYHLKSWDMAAGVSVTSVILRNICYFFFQISMKELYIKQRPISTH